MVFVSLAALALTHLALTNIYHGGTDVWLGWRVVQVSAAVLMTFIATTVVTMRRILRSMRKGRVSAYRSARACLASEEEEEAVQRPPEKAVSAPGHPVP